MSATEALQAEIKTLVEAVAAIGPVYDYPRWAIHPNDIESQLAVADDTIRTWRVQYTEVLPGSLTEQRRTQGDNLEHITIEVVHYREIFDPGASGDPASFPAFMAMLEAIRNAIRPHVTTDTAQTLDIPSRLAPEMVELGGGTYKCHRGRIMVVGHCVTKRE
jgi:hypothetical protein